MNYKIITFFFILSNFLLIQASHPIMANKVIEVNDRTEIHLLGRISTGGDSYDVQVVSDIAFVTCGYLGLKIFNITDPSNLIK
ncbi:MAG: hypothetical protein ACW98D_19835, partial [Promethearchaeota archaeon]